jgi:probable rRNA maturation factor
MPKERENFSVKNTTKAKLPRLAFLEMKNAVLGGAYELSLVIVGDARSRELNRIHRKKDKATDVLAFPLSKKEGEIFLNLKRAAIECRKFGRSAENFTGFLFIHALMHLKGFTHSSRMESEERKIRLKFDIQTRV